MTVEKLDLSSPDLVQGNIEKIRALFPNFVTEGPDGLSIDFDALRQELSDTIVEGPQERYRLDWPGKRAAMLAANTPISKTFRPVREESVDFDTTQNLFIEGDNLDALKLLQDSYLGKVKMIYIDPPYNTGKDFIYKDNFTQDKTEYLEESGQVDKAGGRLVANAEANGRFHSDWLSMMYPRLKLARNLLTDDGVVFISIDDNEQAALKKICDTIFGADNFIASAGRVTKKSNNKGDFWAPNFDYLLTYGKNVGFTKKFFGGVNTDAYKHIDEEGPRAGEKYQLVRLYMSSLENRNPDQRFFIDCPDGQRVIPPGSTFPPERPNLGDGIWRWTKKKFDSERDSILVKKVKSSNLVTETGEPANWNVFTKTYLNDVIANASAKPNSLVEDHINQSGSHELRTLGIPFDFSKPSSLIQYLMEVSRTDESSIVMDFFAGSGTTAHAVMKSNLENNSLCKFITVQLPQEIDEKDSAFRDGYRDIAEISKERIRRAGAKILKENPDQVGKLDVGFRVLKIDSSNMKDVHANPRELKQGELLDSISHIKPDRSGEDLLFQVMLNQGIELSQSIARESVEGKTVYIVGQDNLIACFDDNITDDVVKSIAGRNPLYAIFRDESFKEPADKINAAQIFKQLTEGHTRMKVI